MSDNRCPSRLCAVCRVVRTPVVNDEYVIGVTTRLLNDVSDCCFFVVCRDADNDRVSSVDLSGTTDIPRIKELQRVAIEAQDNIETLREESEANLQQLVEDEDDELEPLF